MESGLLLYELIWKLATKPQGALPWGVGGRGFSRPAALLSARDFAGAVGGLGHRHVLGAVGLPPGKSRVRLRGRDGRRGRQAWIGTSSCCSGCAGAVVDVGSCLAAGLLLLVPPLLLFLVALVLLRLLLILSLHLINGLYASSHSAVSYV